MRLLVVDDDTNLAKTVAEFLTHQNYVVDVASDGQLAWEFAQTYVYDLIVLDVVLPQLDGVSLCRKLRQEGHTLPILLLTVCDSSLDKVKGLDAGADDYVIKPCDWQELSARIRALLRRESFWVPSVLTWGSLSLNLGTCEVRYAEELLSLRPREYRLLELFLRNPSRVFSCGAILDHLWSFEDLPSEDTVRAHIKGLRQKLKIVGAEQIIETVYGLGYRLKPVKDLEDLLAVEPSATSLNDLPNVMVVHELQQTLAAAWEDVKPSILGKVAFLEQFANTIQPEALDVQQYQQAIAEAHKLAGSVGSYGFQLGSQISRQIEALLQGDLQGDYPSDLQSDRLLDVAKIARLQALIFALRQELLGTSQLVQPASATAVYPLALRSASFARVLVVDDDLQMLELLKTVLEPWGLEVETLSEPLQFWDRLVSVTPDLLLLDVTMPQLDGLELCEQLRNSSDWAALPVVFLTAHKNTETVQRVFRAGADDFVTKPIVGPELVTRIVTRIERNRFWQRLTERDGLTQLPNRGKFTQDFDQLLRNAELNQAISLVLVGIEQLKTINHQYGYSTGDRVLRHVGGLLQRSLRTHDLLARWSGSKFVIAFQGTTATQAQQRLSDAIADLAEIGLTTVEGSQIWLSATISVVQYPDDGITSQVLYREMESFEGDRRLDAGA